MSAQRKMRRAANVMRAGDAAAVADVEQNANVALVAAIDQRIAKAVNALAVDVEREHVVTRSLCVAVGVLYVVAVCLAWTVWR